MAKGIMFNEHFGLESAVLSGRKTMTRRVDKQLNFLPDAISCGYKYFRVRGKFLECHTKEDFTSTFITYKLPYQVGEIVAIKQSYCDIMTSNPRHKTLAIASKYKESAGWNNKMFVKNDLMPHQIKITNIRAERLQDISERDCVAEGVIWTPLDYVVKGIRGVAGRRGSAISGDPSLDFDNAMIYDTAADAFSALIDKVSGKGTWKSNPYVWVIEFELI